MSKHVNLLDVLAEGRELPDGCDTWAIRTVRPDGASSNGFVWPLMSGWVEAPGPIIESNYNARPSAVGDGICVAHTWAGMASGRVPARTLLLCAVDSSDVLGYGVDKLRARRAYVASVIDGERLIRERGRRADLRGAYLYRADLRGADLRYADLRSANLYRADLHGADLYGADLYRADLRGAYLYRADLRDAHLDGADLRGANLYRADLRSADLRCADLRCADLRRADLRGADLRDTFLGCADLRSADLRYADLHGTHLHGTFLGGTNLGDWERNPETGLARRKAVA